MPKYRMIDLFAGAGGLTRGFVDTGRFLPVAAVEMDMAAAATYAANFGRDHLAAEDIGSWIDRGAVPTADVVVGGPPCQGFSNLGKRSAEDPRNLLWRKYVEVLRLSQPLYFVVENVPQFLSSTEYSLLRGVTRGRGPLRDYQLSSAVIDTAEFGLPQRRKRALVIGSRRDVPQLEPLVPTQRRSTVGDALAGLPQRVEEVDLPEELFAFGGRVFPGAFKTSQLHLTRRPTGLSVARYQHVPEGGNRFDVPDELLPECWRKHTSGSTDVMGRLSWDKPSVTIRTEFYKPEKGRYLHPVEHRPITHCEAALLQTFDDNHVWCGSKTAIGRQIGNAVPPAMAKIIAQHLLGVLQ